MSVIIKLPYKIVSALAILSLCSLPLISTENAEDVAELPVLNSTSLQSRSMSDASSEVGRSSEGLQTNNARTLSRIKKKLTGSHDVNFGFEIPLPEVIPDPYVKINHHLDYWPYNRIYKFSFFSVLNVVVKVAHYLFDFSTLGLKIVWQLFDYFHMKKSFDQLSHHHGPGWDDDKRDLTHLLA